MDKRFLLKQQRSDLGLTQIELAKQLEVSNNTIARWESGVLPISRIVELAMERLVSIHSFKGVIVTPKQTASDNKNLLPSVDKKKAKTEKVKNLPELPKGDKWIETDEIVKRTGKPKSTIRYFYNLPESKRLESKKIGMKRFVKESDLNAFLENRKTREKSKP
jgi:DNA-binding XRE family transcriptional regulator